MALKLSLASRKVTCFCVIVLQLCFFLLFSVFSQYGSESNAADPGNSYHPVFGGKRGKNVSMSNNFYSMGISI